MPLPPSPPQLNMRLNDLLSVIWHFLHSLQASSSFFFFNHPSEICSVITFYAHTLPGTRNGCSSTRHQLFFLPLFFSPLAFRVCAANWIFMKFVLSVRLWLRERTVCRGKRPWHQLSASVRFFFADTDYQQTSVWRMLVLMNKYLLPHSIY